jgi:hypothetical protein
MLLQVTPLDRSGLGLFAAQRWLSGLFFWSFSAEVLAYDTRTIRTVQVEW